MSRSLLHPTRSALIGLATFGALCAATTAEAAPTPVPTATPLPSGTPAPRTPILTPTPSPAPTPLPTDITPTPTVTPVKTPPVTPTPTPTPTPRVVVGIPVPRFAVNGQATLKTLTKGTLPLTGQAELEANISTGEVSGTLALDQAKGNLVALGFLPVQATVDFASQGVATGRFDSDGGLTLNQKMRIKLPNITLLGLQLGGGSGCQAKNVTVLALRSTAEFPYFDGGTISGTFTISDLVNCGALTRLVSPLTAGSGNAIALKLTR